jgi:hypothetical protein
MDKRALEEEKTRDLARLGETDEGLSNAARSRSL